MLLYDRRRSRFPVGEVQLHFRP